MGTMIYCKVVLLLDSSKIDPKFIKLCKLAQQGMQYILHSQRLLKDKISHVKKNLTAQKENENKALRAARKIRKSTHCYEQLVAEVNEQHNSLQLLNPSATQKNINDNKAEKNEKLINTDKPIEHSKPAFKKDAQIQPMNVRL